MTEETKGLEADLDEREVAGLCLIAAHAAIGGLSADDPIVEEFADDREDEDDTLNRLFRRGLAVQTSFMEDCFSLALTDAGRERIAALRAQPKDAGASEAVEADVPVTDADREAFAQPEICGVWWPNMEASKIAEFAREGMIDGNPLIKAFARHRLAAAPRSDEAGDLRRELACAFETLSTIASAADEGDVQAAAKEASGRIDAYLASEGQP